VHERYRQTTDGRATAYSEREREFTITKNRWHSLECMPLPHYLWRLGLVVARWSRSKNLLYVGPGKYRDGWPSAGG